MHTLPSRNAVLPVVLAAAVILVFALHYFPMLSAGNILRWDEYLTLERSSGFAQHHDWFTVFGNQSPSFHKPPLQYWLTAVLLDGGVDLELALRLWPFLFGLSLLAAVGLLAHAMAPERPWAIPAAVLVMSGSGLLWNYSVSAMLDTGAAFFATLAVAAFLLAIRRPQWWYVVAAAVGLGSMQKAPTALLACAVAAMAVAATGNSCGVPPREIARNPHFRRSAVLMAVLTLFWPLVQTVRYGRSYFRIALGHQMHERFAPTLNLADFQMQWWDWLRGSDFFLWLPAMVAILVLPFMRRRLETLVPALLFALFCASMTLASGRIFDRYLLQAFPLLAAALGAALALVIPYRPLAAAAALTLALCAGQPFQTVDSLGLEKGGSAVFIPFLQDFSRALRDNETPIRCVWGEKWGRIYPAAIHYYAGHGRKFRTIQDPGQLGKNGHPPYRGICHAEQFGDLAALWAGLRVVAECDGMVHWVSGDTLEAVMEKGP